MGKSKHIGKWSCQKCLKEFSHKQSLNNQKKSVELKLKLDVMYVPSLFQDRGM